MATEKVEREWGRSERESEVNKIEIEKVENGVRK